MQRVITLGLILYSFFVIESGIHKLPARIPTHFNTAGEADGWGSPNTLWILLLSQVLIGAFFLMIPLLALRFPTSCNIGSVKLSDLSAEQQDRIAPLFTHMMGNMSVLACLLFAVILHGTIQAALPPHPRLAAGWVMGPFLACTAVNIIYYMTRIFEVRNA
jgi:uncharacterized membrane protein